MQVPLSPFANGFILTLGYLNLLDARRKFKKRWVVLDKSTLFIYKSANMNDNKSGFFHADSQLC